MGIRTVPAAYRPRSFCETRMDAPPHSHHRKGDRREGSGLSNGIQPARKGGQGSTRNHVRFFRPRTHQLSPREETGGANTPRNLPHRRPRRCLFSARSGCDLLRSHRGTACTRDADLKEWHRFSRTWNDAVRAWFPGGPPGHAFFRHPPTRGRTFRLHPGTSAVSIYTKHHCR